MERLAGILFFWLISSSLSAQSGAGKWWVEFTGKDNTPFCLCRPAEFLTARALERRKRAGIDLNEQDLPVDPAYLKALETAGARLHNTSKWLNAAAVIADSATALGLKALPFVRAVRYLGKDLKILNPPNRQAKQRQPLDKWPVAEDGSSIYGYAGLQNSLLGTPLVHATGARGAGIWVAVFDGGFANVDTLPFFDSVALQNRLFQGWDFVERDPAVFESAQHGTSVLSVMASDLPGYFVGTAPEATYFLLKTEDTAGEFPVEEANWVAAAEWADSLGIDIINASLGYTTFNDSTLNHTYAELDGCSAIGSRGAAIAATKGMIICNSAGNSGDEPWQYLGVPSDARGVLAIGAVQHNKERASFSSTGPTADGRIKPDLVAPGEMMVVAGNTGTELGLSSGTSLASPLLAGGLASLWSAYPERPARDILDAVFQSADQNNGPDNERGFGLPNLAYAWLALGGYLYDDRPNVAGEGFFAYDRETGDFQWVLFSSPGDGPLTLELQDALGRAIPVGPVDWRPGALPILTLRQCWDLPAGMYRLRLKTSSGVLNLAGLAW